MSAPVPDTIAAVVRAHAVAQPDGTAFIDAATARSLSWGQYAADAEALGEVLLRCVGSLGPSGERRRIGVAVPDGVFAHVAFLACEFAGAVAVGVGARTGPREAAHILTKARSSALLTTGELRAAMDLDALGLPIVDAGVEPSDRTDRSDGSGHGGFAPPLALTPDELWFLNSTSGTTGLPKLVRHHQRRWFAFHDEADAAGRFTSTDVFCSLLPAPFGFGLWTAHFTPTILGRPCVVADRFDPPAVLRAIERHRVSVMAAVPTQLALLLACPTFAATDFSSLRAVFTGGEMLPYPRAVEFEDRTGSVLLQFYGATETGALSRTSLDDDREIRLRSAGRLLRSMHVRLVDDADRDVTSTGGPAVPVCRGPLLSLGYDGDPEANAQLYTQDGSVRMPDLVTIDPPGDPDGVLTVVGRTTDLIIRGGKNISAAQVEDEVSTHPLVSLAAAVPMPDPVFGERICVYAVAPPELTLDDVTAHLAARGVGRELWPELLVIVEGDLPRSAGGKVAKAALRADASGRAGASRPAAHEAPGRREEPSEVPTNADVGP